MNYWKALRGFYASIALSTASLHKEELKANVKQHPQPCEKPQSSKVSCALLCFPIVAKRLKLLLVF